MLGIQPVVGNEANVRQLKEHSEPEILGGRKRRCERPEQDLDRILVARGKMFAERPRQVSAPVQNGQRLDPVQGGPPECLRIERRMRQRDVVRQAIDGFPVEQILERAAFADGAGRGGQPRPMQDGGQT